jgi:hypothetical protein
MQSDHACVVQTHIWASTSLKIKNALPEEVTKLWMRALTDFLIFVMPFKMSLGFLGYPSEWHFGYFGPSLDTLGAHWSRNPQKTRKNIF